MRFNWKIAGKKTEINALSRQEIQYFLRFQYISELIMRCRGSHQEKGKREVKQPDFLVEVMINEDAL